MFDLEGEAAPTTEQLGRLVGLLARLDDDVDDAERVEQIRAWQELQAAAAAAQAQVTAAFAVSQRAAQEAAGVPAKDVGKGIASQVGLAKRESPFHAARYVGWATILTTELPQTFAALQRGEVTQWRAMIVARETGWLSAEHRGIVDAELAGRLERLGDRRTEAEAKKVAYRLDPHGAVARARGAAADRRVTVRPAPDTMTWLTGSLPVSQGVAAYASLKAHADSLIAGGDRRNRGQIMADTMVERLTGQASADAVPATVDLVMTDRTLFNRRTTHHRTTGPAGEPADEPAHLDGYGPIPADLARRLLTDTPADTAVWLRRLYTDPDTGALVAMDSRCRRFDHGLRQFLVIRDQTCRTQWCDAPVRHADHPIPAAEGGPTSASNGQGLCEACNYAKQAQAWHARPGPGGAGQQVVTTTPTGHTYTSRPPDPPGRVVTTRPAARAPTAPVDDTHSPMEDALRRLVDK
ncbi:MAG TPA: DUF222 domain-containing protein [Nocardioidaceae bacterium]|nr:DUF222 domain-containing protein [Nocardioidaceae bacterium]